MLTWKQFCETKDDDFIRSLESYAQLLDKWFRGWFMYGKQQQGSELLDGFQKLKILAPTLTPMTLYRVEPQERSVNNIIEIQLQPVSSWCKTDRHARSFYHEVSTDKSSPMRLKTHALVESKFKPEEILIDVQSIVLKLDEVLEKLNDQSDFPIRLGNLYHSMKWHEQQAEVIVNAPGNRDVKIFEWLPES